MKIFYPIIVMLFFGGLVVWFVILAVGNEVSVGRNSANRISVAFDVSDKGQGTQLGTGGAISPTLTPENFTPETAVSPTLPSPTVVDIVPPADTTSTDPLFLWCLNETEDHIGDASVLIHPPCEPYLEFELLRCQSGTAVGLTCDRLNNIKIKIGQ